VTHAELVDLIAAALGADVEAVPANERELAAGGLAPGDFPLYRERPHVLDTDELASLGWWAPPRAAAWGRPVE
jgi:hypothetical protein